MKTAATTKKINDAGKAVRANAATGKITAKEFVERLKAMQSSTELEKIQRYFKSGEGQYGDGDIFMGVRMGSLFKLSEEFIEMESQEIEKLLDSPIHEIRAGAVSIMNKQGRSKKTSDTRRKELFDLYMSRHDRINNWDLVDLGAAYVVGRYLFDKSRKILYKLAGSKNIWERRTAIVSTSYFLTKKQVDDTFGIAELLIDDNEDLIHKAAGGWIRQAGKTDRKRLLEFLDRHAATMPRTFLRYAIEHLDKKQKEYYMSMRDTVSVKRRNTKNK
jgi:3-methyladenine DNA glycosylase AlkD